jgi:hypothetical protein
MVFSQTLSQYAKLIEILMDILRIIILSIKKRGKRRFFRKKRLKRGSFRKKRKKRRNGMPVIIELTS